jgi:hypothetical protein
MQRAMDQRCFPSIRKLFRYLKRIDYVRSDKEWLQRSKLGNKRIRVYSLSKEIIVFKSLQEHDHQKKFNSSNKGVISACNKRSIRKVEGLLFHKPFRVHKVNTVALELNLESRMSSGRCSLVLGVEWVAWLHQELLAAEYKLHFQIPGKYDVKI